MSSAAYPNRSFPASRAGALQRLASVLPSLKDAYPRRSVDEGPDNPANVSLLSPYIRHRVLTEQEILTLIVASYDQATAARLVEGMVWRTYWKGWLELRPQVWDGYRKRLATLYPVASSGASAAVYAKAVEGQTGIECFDFWCRELRETGYLHNRARRAFASIWIFTLGLPWELGADFMCRSLLDGDVAINTLSWRWVAGLQSAGGGVLVEAEEIWRQSGKRFRPVNLGPRVAPAAGDVPPGPSYLPAAELNIGRRAKVGLLLTLEDLGRESLRLRGLRITSVALAPDLSAHDHCPRSPLIDAFRHALLQDAAGRYRAIDGESVHFLRQMAAADVLAWARENGFGIILVPYVPLGPLRSRIKLMRPELARAGLRLVTLRREWDSALWGYARQGFPELKRRLPQLLGSLCDPQPSPDLMAAMADEHAGVDAPEAAVLRMGCPRVIASVAEDPAARHEKRTTQPPETANGAGQRVIVVERRRRRLDLSRPRSGAAA
jgi:hypothetical protein